MAGEKEKPLTRADVLRLIEENGDTAEGLDLSGKVFEEGIDLHDLDLAGIILKKARLRYSHLEGANLTYGHLKGANLSHAHLERANLEGAHLEKAALPFAHLEGAILFGAHLERAELRGAHLEGAFLAGAEFSSDTRLDNIDWGNFILKEEKGNFFKEEKPSSFSFRIAAETYRRLKIWYSQHGMYDVSGEFFFREMTAKRKALKWWPNPFPQAWSKFISLICGYGERPLRVVASATLAVLGLALLYFLLRGVAPYTFTAQAFLASLYYSAVSFTALGYGPWFNDTSVHSWVQGAGAAEAFIGVFMMALFLITFIRKMTR